MLPLSLTAALLPAFAHASEAAADPMPALASALVGEWRVRDHDEPSVEVPGGGDGTGHETWRVELDSKVITERLSIKFPHTGSSLYAALWWDNSKHSISGIACAAFIDTGCAALVGEWVDHTLTLRSTYQSGGASYSTEETYRIDGNRFVQTVYVKDRGGSRRLVATIRGTRAQAAHH